MPADYPDLETCLRHGEACLKTMFGQSLTVGMRAGLSY